MITGGIKTESNNFFGGFNMKKEVTCLNCGHTFVMTSFSCDELGPHTTCPKCEASFDIDIEDVLAYHKDFKKRECKARRTISPGEHFVYNDMEFVCLDVFDNTLLAVTAEIVGMTEFSDTLENDCCDWTRSKIRAWLNNEFIKRFNKEDLMIQTSDLTAADGVDAYGTCGDYITLLSIEQYKKYRDYVPHYKEFMWTITPEHCSIDSRYMRCVTLSGAIYSCNVSSSNGIVPVCLFDMDGSTVIA
jgi:hypothetical protein